MKIEQELFRVMSVVRELLPDRVGAGVGIEDAHALGETIAVTIAVSWWFNDVDYGGSHVMNVLGSSLTDALASLDPQAVVRLVMDQAFLADAELAGAA